MNVKIVTFEPVGALGSEEEEEEVEMGRGVRVREVEGEIRRRTIGTRVEDEVAVGSSWVGEEDGLGPESM